MSTNGNLFLNWSFDFDDSLENIRKEYNRVRDQNIALRKQLLEWNKNEEIKKANERALYYQRHSLHELSEREAKCVSKFKEIHYASCQNTDTFLFKLTGTGIGELISIKCPICGSEEDITDIDNW